MKILIAVPTYENIYPDTFKSIYDLDKGGHECPFEYVRGYDCATARNNIAQMALDMNADYVLMVDNDVVMPKDTLVMMLEEPKDVCLGPYAHRKGDTYKGQTCICRLYDSMGVPYFNFPAESLYTWNDLRTEAFHKIEIHGGGMGCALIKTDVFRRLKYPWYLWVNYADKHGRLSEDLYFCAACKKAGIPIYTDTRIKCEHMFRYRQGAIYDYDF